jgi:hypothetical protein
MVKMVMTAPLTTTEGLRTQAADDLAAAGWLVELVLEFADREVEHRYFAVGLERAVDAEEAVLRYPGITRNDPRYARRPLTSVELEHLVLNPGTIRPYGFSISSKLRK